MGSVWLRLRPFVAERTSTLQVIIISMIRSTGMVSVIYTDPDMPSCTLVGSSQGQLVRLLPSCLENHFTAHFLIGDPLDRGLARKWATKDEMVEWLRDGWSEQQGSKV
jgi:hypothetical protein